jgi:hypothetical protein
MSLETPLTGSINADSGPPKDPRKAAGLPGLDQQVLISWVFIQASVFLLGGFIFLQWGIHYPDSYFAQWPNVGNMVFMCSCIGWFLGFVLLTHWTIYAIGDTSSAGFLGTLFKLVASVFFNMQPMSAMWEEDAAGITAASQSEFVPGISFGFGWSNFLGIWCGAAAATGLCLTVYRSLPHVCVRARVVQPFPHWQRVLRLRNDEAVQRTL